MDFEKIAKAAAAVAVRDFTKAVSVETLSNTEKAGMLPGLANSTAICSCLYDLLVTSLSLALEAYHKEASALSAARE